MIRVQLQVGISQQLMIGLKRVQDIVSQKRRAPASLEDCLHAVTTFYLQRQDPVEKAKKHLNSKEKRGSGISRGASLSWSKSRPSLPATVKHHVYFKYKGRCAYVDAKGKRCDQMRHLEIHHIVPRSKGGKDTQENLILLCRGHHRSHHMLTESNGV